MNTDKSNDNLENNNLRAALMQQEFEGEALRERMAQLELALEDASYLRLTMQSEREFSRDGLREICELAKTMYLKNPLIQRGVNVQRDYVFGQGISIRAEDEQVDDVVQDFLDDDQNQTVLTSLQAMGYLEIDLNLYGNLFFVFFTNPTTGRVRVRTAPVDEVAEIITNPEDMREAWFYKRVFMVNEFDEQTGTVMGQMATAWYPDWHYRPATKVREIGGWPVRWESPVFHVRSGGLGEMRFGVSEVYAGIDWALAYKNFLEDWATIVRAYSRFAWQLSTRGGKSAISAIKAKLATTVSSSSDETNPAPIPGSVFIAGEGQKLDPVRTSGATTSADDGRRLLLMVAATMGLPETFFGDVSVGTLATGKSLDRPTELKMRMRQSLWKDLLTKVLNYVIYWGVKAGKIDGVIVEEEDGTPRVELADNTDLSREEREVPQRGAKNFKGKKSRKLVHVVFPPILEHDVAASVQAIVTAATLGNYQMAGTIDERTVTRMLLTALGETDMEEVMDALYGGEGNHRLTQINTDNTDGEDGTADETTDYSDDADNADNADGKNKNGGINPEEGMARAAGELREAVRELMKRMAWDAAISE